MSKFRVYLFVFAALLSVMSLQALAQNVGDAVFQNPIDTTVRGAVLFPFVAWTGTTGGFSTGVSLSNLAPQAGIAALPATDRDGYVTFIFVNKDGTKTSIDSRTLPQGGTSFGFQSNGSLKSGTTATFFIDQILTQGGGFPPTGTFIGYLLVTHTFTQGTGTANIIDSVFDFNISYIALDLL